jgi:hypothetical protein
VFRFLVGVSLAFTVFLAAAQASLPATEYHFFPNRSAGTVEKSLNGVILTYSRGMGIGYAIVQDSSGKKHTYYLARTVLYNGVRVDCFGSVGDGGGTCSFPDANFALGATTVTVYYFPATYNGKSVSVVDNITSGAAPAPSP